MSSPEKAQVHLPPAVRENKGKNSALIVPAPRSRPLGRLPLPASDPRSFSTRGIGAVQLVHCLLAGFPSRIKVAYAIRMLIPR